MPGTPSSPDPHDTGETFVPDFGTAWVEVIDLDRFSRA
jgi:hypothetical protein